jgi:hypothetical protein
MDEHREHVLRVIAEAEEVLYLIGRRLAELREREPERPTFIAPPAYSSVLFEDDEPDEPSQPRHLDTGGHNARDKKGYEPREEDMWWRNSQS